MGGIRFLAVQALFNPGTCVGLEEAWGNRQHLRAIVFCSLVLVCSICGLSSSFLRPYSSLNGVVRLTSFESSSGLLAVGFRCFVYCPRSFRGSALCGYPLRSYFWVQPGSFCFAPSPRVSVSRVLGYFLGILMAYPSCWYLWGLLVSAFGFAVWVAC